MTADRADIDARVHLYPTEEGGRKGPTPPEIFRCLLEVDGEFFDCAILLTGDGPIFPGQGRVVPIVFLSPELVKGKLHPGSQFRLWDGKFIGEVEVVRVIA